MAVPKRKVTPSRKKMRSANKGLKALNIGFDKTIRQLVNQNYLIICL